MIDLEKVKVEVAKILLKIGAVGFRLSDPLTFKSGLISPVYIDNRKFPFHSEEWQIIIRGFEEIIKAENIEFDIVAGIESAGIPHSAALGFYLKKPSVFTRKGLKDHGTMRMVEGGDVRNKKVLLVEDHVSTGYSSLIGVDALRKEGARVSNCFSITSYGFDVAEKAFKKANVSLHTLTDFKTIFDEALKQGILNKKEISVVSDWISDPWGWAGKYGFDRYPIT